MEVEPISLWSDFGLISRASTEVTSNVLTRHRRCAPEKIPGAQRGSIGRRGGAVSSAGHFDERVVGVETAKVRTVVAEQQRERRRVRQVEHVRLGIAMAINASATAVPPGIAPAAEAQREQDRAAVFGGLKSRVDDAALEELGAVEGGQELVRNVIVEDQADVAVFAPGADEHRAVGQRIAGELGDDGDARIVLVDDERLGVADGGVEADGGEKGEELGNGVLLHGGISQGRLILRQI